MEATMIHAEPLQHIHLQRISSENNPEEMYFKRVVESGQTKCYFAGRTFVERAFATAHAIKKRFPLTCTQGI
jgi:hypothetical protein